MLFSATISWLIWKKNKKPVETGIIKSSKTNPSICRNKVYIKQTKYSENEQYYFKNTIQKNSI